MATKKTSSPLSTPPAPKYPEGLVTLWSVHGPRQTGREVADSFAADRSYWGYPARTIETFEGAWHDMKFVGTVRLVDGVAAYWLIGDSRGHWQVCRE